MSKPPIPACAAIGVAQRSRRRPAATPTRPLKPDLPKSNLLFLQREPATVAWFAIQLGPSSFGIFDTFRDEAGREAHLAGRLAAALTARASELLSHPPSIERADVVAALSPW